PLGVLLDLAGRDSVVAQADRGMPCGRTIAVLHPDLQVRSGDRLDDRSLRDALRRDDDLGRAGEAERLPSRDQDHPLDAVIHAEKPERPVLAGDCIETVGVPRRQVAFLRPTVNANPGAADWPAALDHRPRDPAPRELRPLNPDRRITRPDANGRPRGRSPIVLRAAHVVLARLYHCRPPAIAGAGALEL